MKLILSKSFLKYFLVSSVIFTGILLLQYLFKYSDDIFGKAIPTGSIPQLIFYSFIALSVTGVLFGILVATLFSYKHFSNKEAFSFKYNLINGLVLMILFSFLFFSFNNWILPKVNLELRSLFYDIKRTDSDTEFKRTDKELFRNSPQLMTIKEINQKVDINDLSINNYMNDCDLELSLLPESIARELYETLELAKYSIPFTSAIGNNYNKYRIDKDGFKLKVYKNEIEKLANRRPKYIQEKTNRIIFSIEMIILYLIAASFGYLYKNQKPFLHILLALFTAILFHEILLGFHGKVSFNSISYSLTVIISLIVILIPTIFFTLKSIKKESRII